MEGMEGMEAMEAMEAMEYLSVFDNIVEEFPSGHVLHNHEYIGGSTNHLISDIK